MAYPAELKYDATKICDENGYTNLVEFPKGADYENAAINQLAYTAAIIAGINPLGCEVAQLALQEWVQRGGKGEPEGWHRDPLTGRRRPDGDKSREYVNW
jgi:hypothetical protein